MHVTKGTWCMSEQCVPGSLSSFPGREPGNETKSTEYRVHRVQSTCGLTRCCDSTNLVALGAVTSSLLLTNSNSSLY